MSATNPYKTQSSGPHNIVAGFQAVDVRLHGDPARWIRVTADLAGTHGVRLNQDTAHTVDVNGTTAMTIDLGDATKRRYHIETVHVLAGANGTTFTVESLR